MLSPKEHHDRVRELIAPQAQARLPDKVATAVASWLPQGWEFAAASTYGVERTALFLYRRGLLVLRYDRDGENIRSTTIDDRDIATIEMSYRSEWYSEYERGGAENANAWNQGMVAVTATIRFRGAVLDVGTELTLPLAGREHQYPGDWDLVRALRERLLGVPPT